MTPTRVLRAMIAGALLVPALLAPARAERPLGTPEVVDPWVKPKARRKRPARPPVVVEVVDPWVRPEARPPGDGRPVPTRAFPLVEVHQPWPLVLPDSPTQKKPDGSPRTNRIPTATFPIPELVNPWPRRL